MDKHFVRFRKGIIGINIDLLSPDRETRKLVYADWAASGRNYSPIESRIQEEIMPLVANTHTETSTSGMAMTHAYHTAQGVIKDHVNADAEDLIITGCSGMTGLINKFQRMLGFRANEDAL
jgi:selenocysteine lyase/cysteine desulfurase